MVMAFDMHLLQQGERSLMVGEPPPHLRYRRVVPLEGGESGTTGSTLARNVLSPGRARNTTHAVSNCVLLHLPPAVRRTAAGVAVHDLGLFPLALAGRRPVQVDPLGWRARILFHTPPEQSRPNCSLVFLFFRWVLVAGRYRMTCVRVRGSLGWELSVVRWTVSLDGIAGRFPGA